MRIVMTQYFMRMGIAVLRMLANPFAAVSMFTVRLTRSRFTYDYNNRDAQIDRRQQFSHGQSNMNNLTSRSTLR